MNFYSFMLINKDASRIYSNNNSTLFSASICVCLRVIIYTLHNVTVEEKESIEVISFPKGGGSRKNKIEVRAVRFWLKFESDFVLTFLIDAEVPEKINTDSFSQLHHKDRTSAKTSRGVKTHSMNQGRSQSGSSEHAKTVVETWCDKISKHRKNCWCFVGEAWSEKLLTKTTKRTSGIESAKIVISGSQNYEMVFLLQ